MNWLKGLKSKVFVNESTDKHTTLKIGGRASLWIEVFDFDELIYIVKKLKEEKIDFFVIGNGSNILIPDGDLNYVFIRLKSDYFNKIFIDGDNIIARAGVNLNTLLDASNKYSLGGVEFLAGIPASLGGAIYTNAGAQGRCIAEVIGQVKGISCSGKEKILNKDDLNFRYRESGLDDFIITEARLKLEKAEKENILNLRKKYLNSKKGTQPLEELSAGCVFKNSPDSKLKSAQLIERANLKGISVRQAQVSKKHANFIINKGNASFNDVNDLIRMIQDKVKMLYNIELSLEIEILPRSYTQGGVYKA